MSGVSPFTGGTLGRTPAWGERGTQDDVELCQEAQAMELRVSEVPHVDLLDPDARTTLLMVMVDGLISL